MQAKYSAKVPGRLSPRSSFSLGVLSSMFIHLALFSAMSAYLSLPSIGIEFTLPTQVEFGLAEQVKLNASASPPSIRSGLDNKPSVQQSNNELSSAKSRKKPKEKQKNKSDKENTVKTKAKTRREPDAGLAGSAKDSSSPRLGQYAPAGAQIALRIDMEKIRNSPFAEDVRQVLSAVPDWQLVLGGSGIDPVAQLDRVFIASPNLKRSSLVVAGKYAGDEDVARNAVANLAAAQGQGAEWRSDGAVSYAPWLNQDETDRVLALVGPQQFVISTPADLPRVIAVANALAERLAKEGKKKAADTSALLAMEPGEAWSISVEGARNFARGDLSRIPSRLVVSAVELPEERVEVRATGYFDSPEQAAKALVFWEKVRRRYAAYPLLLLVGMSSMITDAVVEAKEQQLHARSQLTVQQVRVVLGLVRNALAPPPSQQQTTPSLQAPPSSEQR